MLRFGKFVEGIRKSYGYFNKTLNSKFEQLEERARFALVKNTLRFFTHVASIFFYFFDDIVMLS
jgi:hypothetical protein